MYVSAFLFTRQDSYLQMINCIEWALWTGVTNGQLFISATNPDYIQRSLNQSLHDRWGPNTYTVTTEHAFVNVTNAFLRI